MIKNLNKYEKVRDVNLTTKNLIDSRVRMGGKVGAKEQADFLEMSTNREGMDKCLEANGISRKTNRDSLIEERSLKQIVEEDLLNTFPEMEYIFEILDQQLIFVSETVKNMITIFNDLIDSYWFIYF